MPVTKDRRTTERKPVMRIFLTLAGLAGLRASTSAPMAAEGPGNNDRNASNRNQIILIDGYRSDDWHSDDWGQRNDRPCFNPQGPYGSGHNPAWNGPGYGQY